MNTVDNRAPKWPLKKSAEGYWEIDCGDAIIHVVPKAKNTARLIANAPELLAAAQFALAGLTEAEISETPQFQQLSNAVRACYSGPNFPT